MDVGRRLLERARAIGARTLAVVGTSKNAGKTVAVGAVCAALQAEGTSFGLCSTGRDGESIDALEGTPKPRYRLRRYALVATASALVPEHPACEILEVTRERSALGPIVFLRTRTTGYLEIAGPPNAAALRRIATALGGYAEFVVIDGAIDRLAALRGARDAIVISVGTSAPTQARAVDDARALVARLSIARFDPAEPALHLEGALTAARAAALVAAGERRQVVVGDATQITFAGRTFESFSSKLDLRCEHALRPIACTVAPRGPERSFDPRAFLWAITEATGLPAYDVFAGAEAA